MRSLTCSLARGSCFNVKQLRGIIHFYRTNPSSLHELLETAQVFECGKQETKLSLLTFANIYDSHIVACLRFLLLSLAFIDLYADIPGCAAE